MLSYLVSLILSVCKAQRNVPSSPGSNQLLNQHPVLCMLRSALFFSWTLTAIPLSLSMIFSTLNWYSCKCCKVLCNSVGQSRQDGIHGVFALYGFIFLKLVSRHSQCSSVCFLIYLGWYYKNVSECSPDFSLHADCSVCTSPALILINHFQTFVPLSISGIHPLDREIK